MLEPALALVVDSRLEVDAAKGHRSGDRVEGGLGNVMRIIDGQARRLGAEVKRSS
jgi:hypothetical protein